MGIVVFKPRPTRRAQALRQGATPAERMLWAHLGRRQLGGYNFSRQMPVGPFISDFLCREKRLVVEVDGGQHADREAQDLARTQYLESEGYKVVRFWNNEVLENVDGVLIRILEALEGRPTPGPSRKREGSA